MSKMDIEKVGESLAVEGGGLLNLRYIPLPLGVLLDGNSKLHDKEGIKESIREYGFQDPGKWDRSVGGFVFGNGRTTLHELLRVPRVKRYGENTGGMG